MQSSTGLRATTRAAHRIVTEVPRFARHAGGARVFLKREDLNHTGSHKINNVLGQALLTKRIGKTRVIAETGAGQHGVATATAAALMDLECVVYMGEEDTERQSLNVARMRLLGATVVPVTTGSRTLKDAINEAYRDWVANVDTTNYIFGTAAGPHPFPAMVRDFQRVIGVEAREQMLALGGLPDAVVACVGGGSNAIGIFDAFLDDADVRLIGCEAAGDGVETGRHASTITGGSARRACTARARTSCRTTTARRIESHSICAGLDYPGVGPQHAWLAAIGRAEYWPITDAEAMEAFRPAVPHRGDPACYRVGSRARRRHQAWSRARPGRHDPGEPFRTRRQGRRASRTVPSALLGGRFMSAVTASLGCRALRGDARH